MDTVNRTYLKFDNFRIIRQIGRNNNFLHKKKHFLFQKTKMSEEILKPGRKSTIFE